MTYTSETQYNSLNYTAGRQGRKAAALVIHHWGSDGQSHRGVVDYLCRQGGGSSAHYVASAGLVTCIVDPDDTAWHAGDWEANLTTVGIECRPEMSEGDFETVAELVADLRRVYGNLPLRPHKLYSATACPGRWEAQLQRLSNRADEILKGSKPTPPPAAHVPAPTPAPAPVRFSNEQLADRVIAGHYGNDPARSDRLRSEGYDPGAVQAAVNRKLAGSGSAPAPVNIDALARAVIRGEYGNGAERTGRLGVHAAAVQARVNQILVG